MLAALVVGAIHLVTMEVIAGLDRLPPWVVVVVQVTEVTTITMPMAVQVVLAVVERRITPKPAVVLAAPQQRRGGSLTGTRVETISVGGEVKPALVEGGLARLEET